MSNELSGPAEPSQPQKKDADVTSASSPREVSRRTIISAELSMYSGPIPHPELLKLYDDLDPGRAAKLLQLAKPTPKPMTAVQTPPAETKREVFTLAEGDVLVQWPAHLSPESVEDLEDHLNLILRKVKRSIAASETSGQS